jgi:predicted ATP-dependent protease
MDTRTCTDTLDSSALPEIELPAAALYRACDPARLPTPDSALADLLTPPGQQRALDAIEFGLGIRRHGYNIFVFGNNGSGRHALVLDRLQKQAATESTPDDWCYVNNFDESRNPRVLQLPPGRGEQLRAAMRRLVDELLALLPGVFDRDEFRGRREKLDEKLKQQHEDAFGELARKAEEKNIALVRTPVGFSLIPTRHGEPMRPEHVQRLPEAEHARIQADIDQLHAELEHTLKLMPDWEREHREAVRDLVRETAAQVIEHLIHDVRAAYCDLPAVGEYLNQAERDIQDHIDEFLLAGKARSEQTTPGKLEDTNGGFNIFRRYRINVAVHRAPDSGAPVVYEDHPTHQRLAGRIEHLAQQGALLTDFNLIVPGALHRANGGYLVLDAERLLMNYFSWDALKRAIRSRQLRVESVEETLGIGNTISLEPEAIPLDVTIVLIGSPMVYYLLSALDPDLNDLFKVAAELEPDVERTDSAEFEYAQLLLTIARREQLRTLLPAAMARIIEYSARLAGDAQRLSTNMATVIDLLQEANFFAEKAAQDHIDAVQVQAAIDARIERADRLPTRMREEIVRGTLRIETGGEHIGQINGLSVFTLGTAWFGLPSRITASVRIGRGEVVDIERQVHLGGPIHSKGVMILTGFLAGRFGRDRRLSLAASLVFEQSYGNVEGDSASAAELFALLSAIAEVPIRQCFAVTGSVDQRGQIQAIGGVNDKLEGFFDVCRARGLSGEHGVIIPRANVRDLMLRADVREAVGAGRFRICAIDTVDQGIELLTGIPAGAPDANGEYPEGTVNRRVADQLARFARVIEEEKPGAAAAE